jgi:hypothetical protein
MMATSILKVCSFMATLGLDISLLCSPSKSMLLHA